MIFFLLLKSIPVASNPFSQCNYSFTKPVYILAVTIYKQMRVFVFYINKVFKKRKIDIIRERESYAHV